MKHDIDWSKCHNGLFLCRRHQVDHLMPEVVPILEELHKYTRITDPRMATCAQPGDFWTDKLIDVKVHMLMPGQYPCIPNWRRDFTPRDSLGERLKGWRAPKDDPLMWMWLSGPPLTLYRSASELTEFEKSEQAWHSFTRNDAHRGQKATEHCWRGFIRVIPEAFVHEHTINVGQIRRHSQVYLSDKFRW